MNAKTRIANHIFKPYGFAEEYTNLYKYKYTSTLDIQRILTELEFRKKCKNPRNKAAWF
jgi:hypothetical protein